ncbi:MAG: hypothetical protein AAFR96_00885 [Planctomycetota bacterium]
MSGAKPWQIALVVIGLLAGGVGVAFAISSMGPVETKSSVFVADVVSGELFSADTAGKTVLIPMTNPETGENTLYPVIQDEESGEWTIAPRYINAFRNRTEDGETPVVDRSTGAVAVTGSAKSL